MSIQKHSFFNVEEYDICGQPNICNNAKILLSLKHLGYGCSMNAWRDFSRCMNQLDSSLLRCFLHALLTTLSFMHVTCAHVWKRIQNVFHCCMTMSMGFLGCLVHWIACMYIGRTAPSHTKDHTRERRSFPLWCWRQSQITTYGFGMLHLVSQVLQ